MPQEIERRFLVRSLVETAMPRPEKQIRIEQGYFETLDIGKSFRVRICDDQTAYLTMKTGKGFIREEIECSVNLEFARALMKTCSHKLYKERWVINGWEVDLYAKPLKGIIIAEKELSSPEEELILPHWLKGVIEVTDTLTNHHLARLATDLSGTDVMAMPYVSAQLYGTIPRIVLTGGPCSGKSTIIDIIKRDNPEIHCVPEMATVVISHFGVTPSRDAIKNRQFQRAIYRAQRIFEATSTQFAISAGKKAVVFDRGAPDGAAYFRGGIREFQDFFNTTMEAEYDQYDAVLCLNVPPSSIYEANKENNPARSETYKEAVDLGERIIKAWQTHPNFLIINNGTGWEDKEKRVLQALKKFTQIP